ncbi:MAG TPA: hypothetical protein VLM79_25330 [Kofleriaceae bacterium]|nr:hypothetical protein [Kofleriaceae bacterium]
MVLAALVGGLFFGGMRESHAITSCNVCADKVHLCSFPCYIGDPTEGNATATTCKAAGYKCVRALPVTSDDACPAEASTVAAFETAAIAPTGAIEAIDVVTLAATWLRNGIALVTGVIDQVASLESGAGVRLARS